MPASSKAQQRLMGLVKAVQAGDVPKSKVSKVVQKMANKMKEKDVDKYASTKHKGLPNKVQSEETLNENPAVIATAARMAIQNSDGKKVSVNTARQPKYADRDPSTHKKAKSIFQRIKDKFKKKDKPSAKKQSKGDANFYAKQFGGRAEAIEALPKLKEINSLLEKNIPTNPSKWSYYKAQAKKKFDVYPSAYANAWAAKQYKAAGGGWRKGK